MIVESYVDSNYKMPFKSELMKKVSAKPRAA
jgi:hypothetical protein